MGHVLVYRICTDCSISRPWSQFSPPCRAMMSSLCSSPGISPSTLSCRSLDRKPPPSRHHPNPSSTLFLNTTIIQHTFPNLSHRSKQLLYQKNQQDHLLNLHKGTH